jgi:Fe2+ or Zn2+ uptake regulation protein
VQTGDLLQINFEADMKRSNLRITHVRQELFSLLKQADKPLTVQELVNRSKGSHFVSVYRSIDAMHKAGIIKQVPRGFKNLFELSDTYRPHHHHATCEGCGKSTSVHDPRLELLMSRLSKNSGLKPTKHTFELFGICHECQKLRQPN